MSIKPQDYCDYCDKDTDDLYVCERVGCRNMVCEDCLAHCMVCGHFICPECLSVDGEGLCEDCEAEQMSREDAPDEEHGYTKAELGL